MLLASFERSLRARGEKPDSLGSSAAFRDQTLVASPTGIAVPPALLPFADEASLTRLLTMHSVASPENDDANFAHLSEEEIGVYFTLTRRVASVGPVTATGQSFLASTPADEGFPDFGPKYSVLQRIAFGGAGEVYLAEDRSRRRKVAIKQLVATLVDDPNWTARFEREMRVMESLSTHPNIVGVLDSGSATNSEGRRVPFYVMEFASGERLDVLLKRRGRLSAPEVRLIFGPVFDALAHVHAAGVVHRDLKPSSILITASGVPKLLDFGLALRPVEGTDELTSVGTVIGTPAYMSPEQVTGQRFDARSDLFSLGVIIFHALTGTNPMAGDSTIQVFRRIVSETIPAPTTLVPELPREVDGFIARMVARRPEDRFPTAEEAKAEFNAAFAGVA
jgi:serine/threonine-protein kinase